MAGLRCNSRKTSDAAENGFWMLQGFEITARRADRDKIPLEIDEQVYL
jgi:hypothetical protein